MSAKLDQPSLAVFKAQGFVELRLQSEECVRQGLHIPWESLSVLTDPVGSSKSSSFRHRGQRRASEYRGSRARPLSSSFGLHLSLYFSQSGVSQVILAFCLLEGSQGCLSLKSCLSVCLHVCVCAYVCVNQRTTLEQYPLLLRQGFSSDWSSALRPDWLASKPQRCSCLLLTSAGVTDTCYRAWRFHMGT